MLADRKRSALQVRDDEEAGRRDWRGHEGTVKASVLILSSLYDFSVDIVLRRLREMEVSYLRLNMEQMADLRIGFDPVTRSMIVRGLGLDSSLEADLRSVWYRSPVFLRNSSSNESLAEQLRRSQWSAFMRSMMAFDEARWMNHPAETYRAETKPYQLLIASRCGFAVPETIVGNDVGEMRKRFPAKVAIKSIDTVYLREHENALFAYTSIVNAGELSDENFHQVPLIAQQFLSPKTDLRVTVVGSSVFAYKILVNGEAAPGDWRLHKRDELTYEPYCLSAEIRDRCVNICLQLNLPFGAIDLIDSDGKIIFIEINPTGEWAWLPDAANTAGTAIAEWLAGRGVA
jgi:glutathione synthase/RimK-type ligase-like ATP-grasp enzyme